MIYVVTSPDCPFCGKQISILKEAFNENEFGIIPDCDPDIQEHDDQIDGFPFVIVSSPKGEILYAASGVMSAEEIRRVIRPREKKPFNLSLVRKGV